MSKPIKEVIKISASEFKLKINKEQGIAYIPKKLRDQFGLRPVILPNDCVAILYSAEANASDIIKSLEVLIKHLELRANKEATPP